MSAIREQPLEAPPLFPTMRCADAQAMIRWLIDVLGFRERVVYRSGDVIHHAELMLGSSILMLGQDRDDEFGKRVGSGRKTDSLYVAVEEIDALFAKVKASGTAIERELYNTDYGSRDFSCRDPEGNLWSFGTYWPKTNEKPLEG